MGLYVGPQIESILGIQPQRWIAEDDCWERYMHPDDLERATTEHEAYLERGGRLVQEYRMIRPDDGRVVWIRDDCTTYPGIDVAPGIVQGVMSDITEQKLLEEQLRVAEAKTRALIEQIPAVVYIEPFEGVDESRFLSAAVETVLGATREQWLDEKWWLSHLHDDDRQRVVAFRSELPNQSTPVRIEYRVVTDDGRVVWIGEVARAVVHDGRPRYVQGLMEDITQRRQAEEQIEFLAYHDVLTGLSNRAMFEEHLELALARARRAGTSVAVLHVDLDGLKRVNDSLGHHAGDDLLVEVAARLRQAIREVDLVARHGGDEFLVMLPDLAGGTSTNPVNEPSLPVDAFVGRWEAGAACGSPPGQGRAAAMALAIAERICNLIAEPMRVAGEDIEVSASIGISLFPDDAEDIRSLLRNADEAMYESKQRAKGRSRVYRQED